MKKSEMEKEVTRLTGLLKNAENNANYWLSQHEDRRKDLDTLIAKNTKLKEQLEAVRQVVMDSRDARWPYPQIPLLGTIESCRVLAHTQHRKEET